MAQAASILPPLDEGREKTIKDPETCAVVFPPGTLTALACNFTLALLHKELVHRRPADPDSRQYVSTCRLRVAPRWEVSEQLPQGTSRCRTKPNVGLFVLRDQYALVDRGGYGYCC